MIILTTQMVLDSEEKVVMDMSYFFKENPSHLSYFSVWQMRGSSHLAQKQVA